MDHKKLTAHIRKRIKASGVEAKVKMLNYCGKQMIAVDVRNATATFSEVEQVTIKLIAQYNSLTFSGGLGTNLHHQTHLKAFMFCITWQPDTIYRRNETATMTKGQWKAEKKRLNGAVTHAWTTFRQVVKLADKIAAKCHIDRAEEALRQHIIHYVELTNA